MIVSVDNGDRGRVFDCSTGKEIKRCIWANLLTGEYEAFETDSNGCLIYDPRIEGAKRYKGKAESLRFFRLGHV